MARGRQLQSTMLITFPDLCTSQPAVDVLNVIHVISSLGWRFVRRHHILTQSKVSELSEERRNTYEEQTIEPMRHREREKSSEMLQKPGL